jgi:hypothetical protein
MDLQYSNHEFGVMLRVCNRREMTATCSVTLQGMDKALGSPANLKRVALSPVPLAIGEPVNPSDCASWIPLVFTTKTDRSELKIESKDPRVPPVFLREGGIWRVRIAVIAEKVGADVFSVWLSWTPGKVPEASDDPADLDLNKSGGG